MYRKYHRSKSLFTFTLSAWGPLISADLVTTITCVDSSCFTVSNFSYHLIAMILNTVNRDSTFLNHWRYPYKIGKASPVRIPFHTLIRYFWPCL